MAEAAAGSGAEQGHKGEAEALVEEFVDACGKGKASVIEELLARRAQANQARRKGALPLTAARAGSHDSLATMLLSKGAEVNQASHTSVTVLYISCERGHGSTAAMLLSNGTDLDFVSSNGLTALDVARTQGHEDVVQILKAHQKAGSEESLEQAADATGNGERTRSKEAAAQNEVVANPQHAAARVREEEAKRLQAEKAAALAQKEMKGELEEVKAKLEAAQKKVAKRVQVEEAAALAQKEMKGELEEVKAKLEAARNSRKEAVKSVRVEERKRAEEALALAQKQWKQKQDTAIHALRQQLAEKENARKKAAEESHTHKGELKMAEGRWQDELKRAEGRWRTERAQLTAELEAASTLAAVSAAEQVPGLGDDELQHLEDAMREERARR